jgi:NAD(P)-dependent dehydrogenase (short-subunit alcohol dehydrogenase family)
MSKTFVVTGAGRGIGLEFCRQLLTQGHEVIATVRDEAKAGSLKAFGPKLKVVTLDVTSPASIDGLAARLGAKPIDVLINNAGVSSTSKSIETLDVHEMTHVFHVNALAPMLVTKALLKNLRAGEGKTIVNITSQLGSIANNTGGSTYAYRASKAALNQLNRSLANELRADGFTCVAVHPGWVRTDMGGPNATLAPEDAVRSMLGAIEKLKTDDTGKFLNYDGTPLPW